MIVHYHPNIRLMSLSSSLLPSRHCNNRVVLLFQQRSIWNQQITATATTLPNRQLLVKRTTTTNPYSYNDQSIISTGRSYPTSTTTTTTNPINIQLARSIRTKATKNNVILRNETKRPLSSSMRLVVNSTTAVLDHNNFNNSTISNISNANHPGHCYYSTTTACTSSQPATQPQSAAADITNLIPFLLADIGEGIKEVELIQWFVAVGDTIQQFDKVCLVQSDKATVEITSRYDGVIASLNDKVEGDLIQVGHPLLYLYPDSTPDHNEHEQKPTSTTPALSNDATKKNEHPSVTLSSFDDVVQFNKNNTNNGNNQSHENRHLENNSTTTTTSLFTKGHDMLDDLLLTEQEHTNGTSSSSSSSDEDEEEEYGNSNNHKFETSPAVRKLAKEYNIDLSSIRGSGPKGRILKSDLLLYLQELKKVVTTPSSASSDASTDSFEQQQQQRQHTSIQSAISDGDQIITLKGYNRFMYKTMSDSVAIPTMGFADEIIMNELQSVRSIINSTGDDAKISMLSLLIKLCSVALKDYPIVNSIVHDDSKMELCIKQNHNIGIAIQTPRGLVVPVLKNCNTLSIYEIQSELDRLRNAAMTSTLSEQDLSDATIALSNIGSIGTGTYMKPVVVTPTLTIGAFGKIQTVPRYRDPTNPTVDNIYPANILYVSWAADHRYLDGATLASFSSSFKQYIENPYSLFTKLK